MTWQTDGGNFCVRWRSGWGGKNEGLMPKVFGNAAPHYTITRVSPMLDYLGSGRWWAKAVRNDFCRWGNLPGVSKSSWNEASCPWPSESRITSRREISQHGSDATIVSSRDHGKTWTPNIKDIKGPMFREMLSADRAFVNTGRNNVGAPDQYVYAVSTDQWDNGSALRVGEYLQIAFR